MPRKKPPGVLHSQAVNIPPRTIGDFLSSTERRESPDERPDDLDCQPTTDVRRSIILPSRSPPTAPKTTNNAPRRIRPARSHWLMPEAVGTSPSFSPFPRLSKFPSPDNDRRAATWNARHEPETVVESVVLELEVTYALRDDRRRLSERPFALLAGEFLLFQL